MGVRGRGVRRSVAAAVAVAILGAVAGGAMGPAAQAQEEPLVYVALGDSFTSGPLVLPHDTTHVPQDCGQSTRNYPHLVALLLGAQLRDRSCGSAEIEDLFEAQDGLPIGGVNPPQADALGPEVDVVTIGMGGNDVGFVGLATGCIRLGAAPPLGEAPCHPGYVVDGVDTVAADIAAMEAELVVALREVQRRAPNAEVFVVSYPTSLPDDGMACWPYLPILPEDMPHLVRWFKAMNGALATAAHAVGATYVDVYTPSIGHDACKLPGLAWVNGAVLVPPSFPAHPNDLSFLASAPVVADAIRAELDDRVDDVPAPASAPAPEAEGAAAGDADADEHAGVPDAAARGRARLPATGGGGAQLPAAAALGAALALGALRRRAVRP